MVRGFVRMLKWGWLKDAIPIFVLFILTIIFFNDVLFGNKVFAHRDLTRYFYPLREFSRNEFLSGGIPLWNPYIHCGSPHLAELQTAVFYPLSVIYLLFSYPYSFNLFIIVHILLAGIGVYILMREWGYSEFSAFLSGMIFMFSGYTISVINLLASLTSVVWFPFAILFYERALKADWVKNTILLGVSLLFMFLGGEPVVLYAVFFILIIHGMANYKKIQDIFRPVFISFLIFIALAMFQILPFLEFAWQSSRGKMDFNEASMWSLPVYSLLDLFVPYVSESDYIYKDYWTRQSWLLIYYMGIFTLISAFISLKLDISRRRKGLFYILALGLLLCFGRYTPLYYFLYKFLPGFKLTRYPIKFFFLAAFSLACLAGIGFDHYLKNINKDKRLEKLVKNILVLGFMSALLYMVICLNFTSICKFLEENIFRLFSNIKIEKYEVECLPYTALYNIKRALYLFMLLALLMFLGIKKTRRKFIIVIMFSVVFFDVFSANSHVYKNIDINEYLEPRETIRFLKQDKSIFRVFCSPAALRQTMFLPEKDYFESAEAFKERLGANIGVRYGIYDAYGYGSLYNARQEEIMNIIVNSKLPDDTNLLNILNVKYVISPKNFESKVYHIVKKGSKVNIYENRNYLNRAFLAERYVIIQENAKVLERLKAKEFNPEKEVILERALENRGQKTEERKQRTEGGNERVEIVKYTSQEVIIDANVNAGKFLVLSDSYYPGWRVYVDGKNDKIYRADYILRAVYLEPGQHQVRFLYQPVSFRIGLLISLSGAIVLLVIRLAFSG